MTSLRISELGIIERQLYAGKSLTYPTLIKVGGFHYIVERTARQRYKIITGYWPTFGA